MILRYPFLCSYAPTLSLLKPELGLRGVSNPDRRFRSIEDSSLQTKKRSGEESKGEEKTLERSALDERGEEKSEEGRAEKKVDRGGGEEREPEERERTRDRTPPSESDVDFGGTR
eukprot:15563-Rhodomonas_salina.1